MKTKITALVCFGFLLLSGLILTNILSTTELSEKAVSLLPKKINSDNKDQYELTQQEPVHHVLSSNAESIASALNGRTGDHDIYRIYDEVMALANNNPPFKDEILSRYNESPNSEMGQVLGSILAELGHPELLDQALRTVVEDNDVDRVVASLTMLKRLGADSTEATTAILNKMSLRSDNLAIVQAGLGSLTPSTDVILKQKTVDQLKPLMLHPDPETRRLSVIAYSEWQGDNPVVAPVLLALKDTSEIVRTAAAYSLSTIDIQSANIQGALMERVADADEKWSVRNQAWLAIEKSSLHSSHLPIYKDFEINRDLYRPL